MFFKKCVLKDFAKFTGKQLYQSLFFNKVADLILLTLLKRRLRHRYFPKNFARFLRAPSDKAIMKRSKQETNYFNHSILENRSKYKICENLCSKLHKIEKKEKKKFYSSLSDINDNKTFWKTMKPLYLISEL